MSRLRERIETEGPVGPWRATVAIDAVQHTGGRLTSLPHDHLFEVHVNWVGPPPFGEIAGAAVQAQDCYVLTNLEAARTLKRKAVRAFSEGGAQAPDLRALAA